MTAKMINLLRPQLLAIFGVALFAAPFARADLVISVTSATVTAGSASNAVDVNLTNTGLADVTIGAFFFGLQASDPAVTFTGATTSTTDPYIFAGDSLFGPDIATTAGPTLLASDLFDIIGSGGLVTAGGTVGLGHVLFDVASNAAGAGFTVSLSSTDTSLADPSGANLPIAVLQAGQVSYASGPSVPEPSPAWPTTLALLFAGVVLWRRMSPLGDRSRVN